jgi:thimet oligopeptidase
MVAEATAIEADATAESWDEDSLDLPTLAPDQITRLTAAAIERANALIDRSLEAIDAGGPLTFETLFGALDDAAREGAVAFGRGASQSQMASDDAVRAAAFAANDDIEKWRAAVATRDDLGAAIERFVATADLATLADDERAYVHHWQLDVELGGAGLPAEARAEVARLSDRLIELGSTYLNNLVDSPHLEVSADELDGVPADLVASFPPGSAPGTVDVAIDYAAFYVLIERATNRGLRERINLAWLRRGYPANVAVLEEALAARRRIAELHGERSWQALRARSLAAGDAATINGFIADMAARLAPAARRELDAMAALLRAEPDAPADLVVEDWDWRYADRLQRTALGVDHEALAEYIELDHVLEGLASLSEEVFGVRLVPHPERTGWHPQVRPFDLVDVASGLVLAHLFVDPFVRHGKQPGAWMEILLPGGGWRGEARPPTLSLVFNAPDPGDGPSILPPDEVETVFHEYGHVLNFSLGCSRFVLHRPNWIAMDFVEGPSSFLGRWGLQPEIISRFARNRLTGEPIPAKLLEGLTRAESLNAAIKLERMLSMGWLDALLHGEELLSIEEANRRSWPPRGTPFVEDSWVPASLTHILGGAYDAALYGYAWSEVIRDDLLGRFEAGGMTSPEVGAAYRSAILEVPWTADPVAAVNGFLGRRWSADAFLARVERPT